MDLQEHINNIIITSTNSKEGIIRAIGDAVSVMDSCDESIGHAREIDEMSYYLRVKDACNKLTDELMKLSETYGSMKDSVFAIKKAWDGYVFKDENNYMSKFNNESRKRKLAEDRLRAVKEMYGADDVKEKLIEYQKYHDVNL